LFYVQDGETPQDKMLLPICSKECKEHLKSSLECISQAVEYLEVILSNWPLLCNFNTTMEETDTTEAHPDSFNEASLKSSVVRLCDNVVELLEDLADNHGKFRLSFQHPTQ
jgi:hypothetical protein